MSADDWRSFFRLCQYHQILPMIYDTVYGCPAFAAFPRQEMQAERDPSPVSERGAEREKSASLLKRALQEIHALGGDYVAVLTGPEKDQEHGPSYGERIAVHHKAVVVEYAPKAVAMAEALERAANEMALQGWELGSSTVTPAAKGILLVGKRGSE